MSTPPFPYADLLSQSMPDEPFMEFLRVCLLADRQAAENLLRDGHLDALLRRRAAARRLLPLLSSGLRATGVSVESRVAALLQTAVLWERARTQQIELILSEVMGLLELAGLAPVVVGGLACARLAYKPDFPRHCHDIDIAVTGRGLGAATEILRKASCTRMPGSTPRERRLRHISGIEIRLHTLEDKTPQLMGHDTLYRMPRLGDVLARLLVHAALSPKRHDWVWIADVTLLSRACPDRQALEKCILSCAGDRKSALAMGYRMQWLAGAGFIAEAPELVGRLRAMADREAFTAAARFLQAACAASGRSGRHLWRRSGLRSRLVIGLWAASRRMRTILG